MAEKRRRLMRWLLPKLLIFVVGAAVGYYGRDYVEQGELEQLRVRYDQVVAELKEVKESGADVLERGRRAGESLRSGAEAAVDSAEAAVEQIKGDTKN